MVKLVIKGAYYYDRDDDTLLVPHYTGEFCIVDCNKYVRMEELKDIYDENYINQVKEYPTEFEGNKYYDAKYSPRTVGGWELLSDLSELGHIENDYDF